MSRSSGSRPATNATASRGSSIVVTRYCSSDRWTNVSTNGSSSTTSTCLAGVDMMPAANNAAKHTTPLPAQFQPDLDLTFRRLGRRRQLRRRGNHVAGPVENLDLRRLKIGGVEKVEGLDAKLQLRPLLGERPVLEQ